MAHIYVNMILMKRHINSASAHPSVERVYCGLGRSVEGESTHSLLVAQWEIVSKIVSNKSIFSALYLWPRVSLSLFIPRSTERFECVKHQTHSAILHGKFQKCFVSCSCSANISIALSFTSVSVANMTSNAFCTCIRNRRQHEIICNLFCEKRNHCSS